MRQNHEEHSMTIPMTEPTPAHDDHWDER